MPEPRPIAVVATTGTRETTSKVRGGLTEEQKKRMEENRRLAEARRKKKNACAMPVPLVRATTSSSLIDDITAAPSDVSPSLGQSTPKSSTAVPSRTEAEKLIIVLDATLEHTVIHHELRRRSTIVFQQDLVAEIMPSVKIGMIRRTSRDLKTCCEQDTLKFLAGYLTEYFTEVIIVVENTDGEPLNLQSLAVASVMSGIRLLHSTSERMTADIIHHVAL